MYLVGGIKGLGIGQFVKEFEAASGIAYNSKGSDPHIVLYHGTDKSVIALLNGQTTVCLEIPKVADEDICCSSLNQNNFGAATVISASGQACRGFGRWRDDAGGIGFCSEGHILENTSVSPAVGLQRYATARSLLAKIEMAIK